MNTLAGHKHYKTSLPIVYFNWAFFTRCFFYKPGLWMCVNVPSSHQMPIHLCLYSSPQQ